MGNSLSTIVQVVHFPVSRRSEHCPILLETGENVVKRDGDSISKFESCGPQRSVARWSPWKDSAGALQNILVQFPMVYHYGHQRIWKYRQEDERS